MELKPVCVLFLIACATRHVTIASGCTGSSTNDVGEQASSFTSIRNITIPIQIREIAYTPALIIIGHEHGEIMRCLYDKPDECEVYHVANDTVTSTVIHGEFLYASLSTGAMLQCTWRQKNSCTEFNQADDLINSLAVGGGYIYAGLQNGTLWRCHLNKPNSCCAITTFGGGITALATSARYIYVGLASGHVYYCSIEATSRCFTDISQHDSNSVQGLLVSKDVVIELKQYGMVANYTHTSNSLTFSTELGLLPGDDYGAMAIFRRQLYFLQLHEDIRVCEWQNINNCVTIGRSGRHHLTTSLSFVYASHELQSKYRHESEPVWRNSLRLYRPATHYYDVQQRAELEVRVIDDKLYDSRGSLVDTRSADEGHSGNSAIFVMGPDGQILLSNLHSDSVHWSSLLAGSPVSGAGEMVVENGTIRKITTCSEDYWPDAALNSQVIDALYAKGYSAADAIPLENCLYGKNDILS